MGTFLGAFYSSYEECIYILHVLSAFLISSTITDATIFLKPFYYVTSYTDVISLLLGDVIYAKLFDVIHERT